MLFHYMNCHPDSGLALAPFNPREESRDDRSTPYDAYYSIDLSDGTIKDHTKVNPKIISKSTFIKNMTAALKKGEAYHVNLITYNESFDTDHTHQALVDEILTLFKDTTIQMRSSYVLLPTTDTLEDVRVPSVHFMSVIPIPDLNYEIHIRTKALSTLISPGKDNEDATVKEGLTEAIDAIIDEGRDVILMGCDTGDNKEYVLDHLSTQHPECKAFHHVVSKLKRCLN